MVFCKDHPPYVAAMAKINERISLITIIPHHQPNKKKCTSSSSPRASAPVRSYLQPINAVAVAGECAPTKQLLRVKGCANSSLLMRRQPLCLVASVSLLLQHRAATTVCSQFVSNSRQLGLGIPSEFKRRRVVPSTLG